MHKDSEGVVICGFYFAWMFCFSPHLFQRVRLLSEAVDTFHGVKNFFNVCFVSVWIFPMEKPSTRLYISVDEFCIACYWPTGFLLFPCPWLAPKSHLSLIIFRPSTTAVIRMRVKEGPPPSLQKPSAFSHSPLPLLLQAQYMRAAYSISLWTKRALHSYSDLYAVMLTLCSSIWTWASFRFSMWWVRICVESASLLPWGP